MSPILRWKAGERDALKVVPRAHRRRIIPLVELIPKMLENAERKGTTVPAVMAKIVGDLAKCWGPGRAFVDFHHVAERLEHGDREHPLVNLLVLGATAGLDIVPVVRLRQPPRIRRALIESAGNLSVGACMCLASSDLLDPDLHPYVHSFMERAKLSESQVDIVIDLGRIGATSPEYGRALRAIPLMERWRSVTIAGGAFPKALTGFGVGIHRQPRADWVGWLSCVEGIHDSRIPWYADYTIQHAVHEEPPPSPNCSASVRYAAEDYWLIMRGEGHRKDHGPHEWSNQYIGHAMMLSRRPEYLGRSFSFGDAYIADRLGEPEHPGNPRKWLTAGISHHMALTVRQLEAVEAQVGVGATVRVRGES